MSQLEALFQQDFKSNTIEHLPRAMLTMPQIEKLLSINTNNIPPVTTKINLYADSMVKGAWKYNADSIRVNKNGVLLDGQNRLMAALKAKIPLTSDLVVGLPEDIFNTIDQGRVRTKGGLLARDIGGVSATDGRILNATVTRMIKYNAGYALGTAQGLAGKFSPLLTADKVIEYVNNHPDIINQLETIKKEFPKRANLSQSLILFIYHIGCRWDENYTKKWLKKVVVGVGLQEKETLFMLHKMLNDRKAKVILWTLAEVEKTLMKVWDEVADNGLYAIKKQVSIKMIKGDKYVEFIQPNEQSLIEMNNSI
jgi:hypothetical protein